jgi:NAD(P)-dependent dehydrogenase (short-subunit alcohol dehydrogenase family)
MSQSETPLNGRVVLVTGASKGIGHAIAKTLGEQGAHVIAHYGTDRNGAIDATNSIPENRKLLISADLSKRDGYLDLWQEAINWQGRVDVLIANAAIMPEASLLDSDEIWTDAWDSAFEVNVRSTAFLIRESVKHFLSNKGGVIVGLTSWAAQRGSGNPNLSGYAASKAPINPFLKTIAKTYAKDGVYTYLIAPGIVRTAMSEASAKSLGGEEKITSTLAMGEWVPPQEIANLVAFLSTGEQRHLTGSTFDINGASYIR